MCFVGDRVICKRKVSYVKFVETRTGTVYCFSQSAQGFDWAYTAGFPAHFCPRSEEVSFPTLTRYGQADRRFGTVVQAGAAGQMRGVPQLSSLPCAFLMSGFALQ